MNVNERIEHKVREAFSPIHLQLINESHMHAGPATESHFKLLVVSAAFQGQSRVVRHQSVYKVLQDEMQATGSGSLHALALHLFTPDEWQQTDLPDSPLCAGKNL